MRPGRLAGESEHVSPDECFTRRSYRALLETALESGFEFVSFDDLETELTERVCLLRHDVDADPGAALELARIEADLGVRATYFVMLRSPFYNLCSRSNHLITEEILGLGHWLGLHYDVGFAPAGQARPEPVIEAETAFISATFGAPIRVVSFHQPLHSLTDPKTIRPPGLVTTWDVPGFHYVSDANKAPGAAAIFELFRRVSSPRLHLLIHPIWWAGDDQTATAEMLWERAILANFERSQEQIVRTERAFGESRTLRIEPSSMSRS